MSDIPAIATQIRQQIAAGSLDPASAVGIIRAAASLGASWDTVEAVVAELAKGADGIAGTEDDVIPPSTVALLSALLRSGVVRDMAAWGAQAQPFRKWGCCGS